MMTIGTESSFASANAVMILVAPGPAAGTLPGGGAAAGCPATGAKGLPGRADAPSAAGGSDGAEPDGLLAGVLVLGARLVPAEPPGDRAAGSAGLVVAADEVICDWALLAPSVAEALLSSAVEVLAAPMAAG